MTELSEQSITDYADGWRQFHQLVRTHFGSQELRQLCTTLNVNYKDLGTGLSIADQITVLLRYIARSNRQEEFLNALRQQQPDVSWPAHLPQVKSAESSTTFIPVIPMQLLIRTPSFIGRKAELEQLLTNLQPGQVITLCGPAGVGKKSLVAEAVRHLFGSNMSSATFPDGIVYYDFYQESRTALALEHIIRSFGETPQADPAVAVQQILGRRQALLIFNGIERADDLSAVMGGYGRCSILAASCRQNIESTRQNIHPLPIQETMALLQIWGERHVTDKTTAKQICQTLSCIPLAIRLAGCYMAQQSQNSTDYLAWLQTTQLSNLDLDQRQFASIPTLLEHTIPKLSRMARRILALIGLLAPAPFHRTTIAAILEMASIEITLPLNELISYGLLASVGELYEIIHPLIYTYVQQHPSIPKASLQHLATTYNTLVREQRQLGTNGLPWLGSARPHIMHILAQCEQQKQWPVIRSLVWAIDNYLGTQRYWFERIASLKIGLQAVRSLEHKRDESAFLGNLGNAYRDLGLEEQAVTCYQQALTIARKMNHRRDMGSLWGNLGLAYRALGQTKRAVEYLKRALAISREAGNRQNEASDLGNLGLAYHNLGNLEQSIDYYRQALPIRRELGHWREVGAILGNLGLVHRDLGQLEQATEYYQQALNITRKIGDQRDQGAYLGNLGLTHYARGEVQQAISYYQQALAISREIGHHQSEGNWLGSLGNAYHALGQVEQAVTFHKQALAIARESDDQRSEGVHLGHLGLAYRALGQIELAIKCHEQALSIARKTGNRHGEGTHLGNLGLAYGAMGQVERALPYHKAALAIDREVGDRRGEGNRLSNLGLAYSALGQVERAIEFYEKALTIAREIGDRRGQGNRLGNLGIAYYVLEQVEKAVEYHEQALAIAREIGHRHGEGNHLANLGLAYADLGQIEHAKDFLTQALQIYKEVKSPHFERVQTLLAELSE